MQIRPVSDLRNKFTDIEKVVSGGEPVYLTKNGYGTMVVLSLDSYTQLVQSVETALNEADKLAEATSVRYTHSEVFDNVRSRVRLEK